MQARWRTIFSVNVKTITNVNHHFLMLKQHWGGNLKFTLYSQFNYINSLAKNNNYGLNDTSNGIQEQVY